MHDFYFWMFLSWQYFDGLLVTSIERCGTGWEESMGGGGGRQGWNFIVLVALKTDLKEVQMKSTKFMSISKKICGIDYFMKKCTQFRFQSLQRKDHFRYPSILFMLSENKWKKSDVVILLKFSANIDIFIGQLNQRF